MWICIAQGSACGAVFSSNLSPAVKAFTPKGDSSKDVNILGCLLLMLWNRFTPGRLHTQVSWPDFRWKGSIECKLRDSGDLAMGRCLGNNRQCKKDLKEKTVLVCYWGREGVSLGLWLRPKLNWAASCIHVKYKELHRNCNDVNIFWNGDKFEIRLLMIPSDQSVSVSVEMFLNHWESTKDKEMRLPLIHHFPPFQSPKCQEAHI